MSGDHVTEADRHPRTSRVRLLDRVAVAASLIKQADVAVNAVVGDSENGYATAAKRFVAASADSVIGAGRHGLSPYRRSNGRWRPVNGGVQIAVLAASTGAFADLLRSVLGLSMPWCVVGVLVWLLAATSLVFTVMRRLEARTPRALRDVLARDVEPLAVDVTAVTAIERARVEVAALASQRLAAFATLRRTGPDVIWACKYDLVLAHLRHAESLLGQAHCMVEVWQQEVNA